MLRVVGILFQCHPGALRGRVRLVRLGLCNGIGMVAIVAHASPCGGVICDAAHKHCICSQCMGGGGKL